MVVEDIEARVDVVSWGAVRDYIVRGLKTEGLLDLGVWSHEEVEEDEAREDWREKEVYVWMLVSSLVWVECIVKRDAHTDCLHHE